MPIILVILFCLGYYPAFTQFIALLIFDNILTVARLIPTTQSRFCLPAAEFVA
jgi:hypothetical protein